MLKILHTADWHLDQLSKWINTKSDRFESLSAFSEYHLEKVKEMVDKAIIEKVDFFVFAWDLFSDAVSNFKEKEIITNELLKYINILKKNGIHSVFLSWNHDIIFKKLSSNKNSLSLFSEVDYWDYLFVNNPNATNIEYKDYNINWEEIRFLLFPYIKGDLDKWKIKKEIKKLAKEKRTILVWHLDIFWALYNWLEIQFTNLDLINVWTPEELEDLGTIWNLLWHVHNHQILWKKKITSYCWSPFRLSFNEEKSKKGYYIHKIEKKELKTKFELLENKIWKTIEYNLENENQKYISKFNKVISLIKENISFEKLKNKIWKKYFVEVIEKELLNYETKIKKEYNMQELESIYEILLSKYSKTSFLPLLEKIKNEEIEDWILRIILLNIKSEDYKYVPHKEIQDLLIEKKVFLFRWINYKNISKASLWKSLNNLEFKNIEDSLNPVEILKKIMDKGKHWKKYKEEIMDELNSIINEINA